MTSTTLHADDLFGDPSLFEHHFCLEIWEVVDLGFGVHREITNRFYENVQVAYANDDLVNDQFDFFTWE